MSRRLGAERHASDKSSCEQVGHKPRPHAPRECRDPMKAASEDHTSSLLLWTRRSRLHRRRTRARLPLGESVRRAKYVREGRREGLPGRADAVNGPDPPSRQYSRANPGGPREPDRRSPRAAASSERRRRPLQRHSAVRLHWFHRCAWASEEGGRAALLWAVPLFETVLCQADAAPVTARSATFAS
jgi:hypothetical protein